MTVEDLVLEVLERGPMTSHRLAAVMSAEFTDDAASGKGGGTGTLHGREGLLFPLLFEMRRNGLVRSEWVDAGAGRRLVHAAAGAPPTAPVVPDAPGAPSALLAEIARRATKRLAFAPRLAEEFRVAILQHLQDAAGARTAAGQSIAAAEKGAVRSFGDPWKVGVDLARAAQGKRTVIFPTRLADSVAGVAIYDLRVLLLILGVIVFVRVQVITAYHIPTKSMEPTLHGDPRNGDRILVNKLAGEPGRFDIWVFDGFQDDRKNFVKRAVGLPGDLLLLAEGDVWNHGQLVRKEGNAYEALLFTVFDRGIEATRAAQRSGAASGAAFEKELREHMRSLWRFEGDGECGVQEDAAAPFAGFRLAAPSAPAASPPQIGWHEIVRDVYVDPESGTSWGGDSRVSCCDLRLTADIKPVPGTDARVSFVLTRGTEHTYEAVVRGAGPGVVVFADGKEIARDDAVVLPDGVPTAVSFSQVDRVLRLCVGGRLVLRHDLPAPETPQRDSPAGSAIVRVSRGAAWIDPRRLERDVYYLHEGPDDHVEELGPDQYFMLGDNSSNSSDSRSNGPVHRSRLVGSPLLVVWPPSRIHVPR
jgi:signal peptidase I